MFFVPTVHPIAPTSPTTEATIIETYFANLPFLRHPVYIRRSYMFRARKIVSQMIKKPKLNEAEPKVEISPPRPTRRCSCSSPPT